MRVFIFMILFAVPAVADTGQSLQWPTCYCTDKHKDRFAVGDQVCLTVGGRSFMAECQMFQNVPSWRELEDEICPLSQSPSPTLIPTHPSVADRITALRG